MVDAHALNNLLWGVTIISAVAIASAAAAIALAWLSERRRRIRHVASGVRAAEAHLAEEARERAAR